MENNQYPAQARFKVFILTVSNSFCNYSYTMENAVGEGFPHYDAAKQWVEDEGQRQLDYVILEVFHKN